MTEKYCTSALQQPASGVSIPAPFSQTRERSRNRFIPRTGRVSYGILLAKNPAVLAIFEYRIVLPDTSVRWIRDRVFPIRDGDERFMHMLGVSTDITGEISAETALKNELERKADFLSIASHELKTPLQPIVGYLYLMLENPHDFGLTAEGTLFLEEIQKSITRVNEVVNRILAVSLTDIEQEIVQPHWEIVALEDLVGHVIRACNTGDETTYALDLPPDQTIETDWDYLYETLYEICVNAVKHSDPPHRIVIGYTEDTESHLLSISDNGPGMDETTRRNLFRPFYIGDKDKLSRTCGRLGLGLTIAKKNVEILGGTILVASTPGQGSTFTLRLPKQHT